MSFPRSVLGQHFESLEALSADLERRGRSGTVDHPGQMMPSERYGQASPEDKTLVGQAVASLIGRAEHPELLLMLAHLGPYNRAAWRPALLDRLEHGPPIPHHTTLGGTPLVEELTSTLPGGQVPPAEPERTRRVLAQEGLEGGAVQFYIVHGSGTELADALRAYLARPSFTESLLVYAVGRLASKSTRALMELAPRLSSLSPGIKQQLDDQVKRHAFEWYGSFGDSWRRELGL